MQFTPVHARISSELHHTERSVKYSKTSFIRTSLNQTALNPDRVAAKIRVYFGFDKSRINYRRESEVTAGC
jgi:hypothetical protein